MSAVLILELRRALEGELLELRRALEVERATWQREIDQTLSQLRAAEAVIAQLRDELGWAHVAQDDADGMYHMRTAEMHNAEASEAAEKQKRLAAEAEADTLRMQLAAALAERDEAHEQRRAAYSEVERTRAEANRLIQAAQTTGLKGDPQ